MKLIFATLYLGQSRLVAVVEEPSGKQRRIELRWLATKGSDVPPEAWLASVYGEAEEQRSIESRPFTGFMR